MLTRSLRGVSVLAVFLGALHAQTSRGTVGGLVTDTQRAAVAAAAVELTAVATNVTRKTQSNEAGLYRFLDLEPGIYTLTVRNPGFRAFAANQFAVGAAQVITLDVALEVGDLQQVIEVSGDSIQLQTEAPVRGKNISNEEIVNLPVQRRNPAELALTAPGVTTQKYGPGIQTFVVNGGRGRSNNFMIDGTDNNDVSIAGQAFEIFNPAAVQEVNVQTSNFDAEFGRAAGAVVNVITRSGNNQLHGSAGFVLDSTRDDAISSSLARDPNIQRRGKNLAGTQQQFDGTLGGRILRDRTFYFLNFVEQRQFSQSATEMVSLTADGRARLKSLFPAGLNANADLLHTITQGQDATFQKFNQSAGTGRGDIEFGRLVIPYSDTKNFRQWGAKLDHRINDRNMLTGRFNRHELTQPNGGETLSFPDFNTSYREKIYSSALGYTRVFSPSFTNELRLSGTRVEFGFPNDPKNPLGLTLPQIAIAGINTTAASVYGVRSTFPQGRTYNNYVLQDTVSVIKGTHTMRFGFDLLEQRARQAAPFNFRGILQYGASSQAGQTFTGLANYLDDFGGAGSATRSFGSAVYYPSLFRQAYFFQDRWRATQSLTLSLGVRYEEFGQPMNVVRYPAYAGIYNVDPVSFDAPFFRPSKVAPDRNNFSPMFGLAWAPRSGPGLLGKLMGEKKTVVRMGYGWGYDAYFNNITSNIVASAPGAVAAASPSQVTAALPRGASRLSTLMPVTAPAITPLLRQSAVIPDLRNPYYQKWSFGVQRELPGRMVLDMSYVGSKGMRLFAQEDLNPLVTADLQAAVPASVPANRRQPRLDPLSGERAIRTNGGNSIYHSGQFEMKRRFASGIAFTAAYTWSKAIDNVSEIFTYGNSANIATQGAPSMFGGLQLDRSVSFFDRPHRAVFTYQYALPWMKEQRGPLGRVVGGWSLVGITTFESGVPYTVVNGQDADGLGGSGGDRPDFNPRGQAGVRAVPNSSSPTGYVNPDAANAPIDPATARYIGIAANSGLVRTRPGNLGRNTERQRGLRNFDLNVNKDFLLTERFRLQFRTELFNVFNTPQYGTVSASPFAPAQSTQTVGASVFNSQPGLFLNNTFPDGGGRVIRWQLRLSF